MFKALRSGLIFGLGALLLICSALSVLQLFADIPDGILMGISASVLGISSYSSAYFSTQLCRTKGLIQGIICGCAVFLAALLASAITKNFSYTNMTEIKAAVCVLCGAVGGVKGINTKKTKL